MCPPVPAESWRGESFSTRSALAPPQRSHLLPLQKSLSWSQQGWNRGDEQHELNTHQQRHLLCFTQNTLFFHSFRPQNCSRSHRGIPGCSGTGREIGAWYQGLNAARTEKL